MLLYNAINRETSSRLMGLKRGYNWDLTRLIEHATAANLCKHDKIGLKEDRSPDPSRIIDVS